MSSRKKESPAKNGSTKITDFYKSPVKIRLVKEDGVLKVKNDSDLDRSLQSSSVLLTPDASPSKEKDTDANVNNNNCEQLSVQLNNVSTQDYRSMCEQCETPQAVTVKTEPTEQSCHCKQIIEDVEILSVTPSPVPSTPPLSTGTSQPKKRRGRRGKGKSAQNLAEVKTESQPKLKTSRKKKVESDITTTNKTITDYFPVRRSGRRCKSELEKERMIEYEDKVLTYCEDGLEVVKMEDKGRGVVATKMFKKGDFVVEYAGDLIDLAESKDREMFYGMSTKFGCYMYYFNLKGKHYCIDATAESGKLGRLLNHSRISFNCCTKLIEIKNTPYLIIIASRDIVKGEELLYDYGDRSKESLEAHPWLKL